MNKSIFDLVGNLDTLLAVVVGAVLATMGALVAELVQDRLNRRRREREAARFFGEIMSNMDRIIVTAIRSHGVGEPWGPVTRRLFRTAMREAQVYDRNRERLFDIRDMELRARIHAHMVTKTFPVDAIIEYCADLDRLDDVIIDGAAPPGAERRNKIDARAAMLRNALANALRALDDEVKATPEICAKLEKLAGVNFAPALARAASNVAPPAPSASGT
ncbi:MAG: hypothetical protein R3C58_04910 [Parvularculaceae bacterium]